MHKRSVKIPTEAQHMLDEFDGKKLKHLPVQDQLDEVVGATLEIGEKLGPPYADASNIVLPVKLFNDGTPKYFQEGADIKILENAIEQSRDSASDPKKIQVMKQVYLALRKKVTGKD